MTNFLISAWDVVQKAAGLSLLFWLFPLLDINVWRRRPVGWGLLVGTPFRYFLYVITTFFTMVGFVAFPIGLLISVFVGWGAWGLFLMWRLGPNLDAKVRGWVPPDPDDMKW